jgi:CheY-like chemotaxis protein
LQQSGGADAARSLSPLERLNVALRVLVADDDEGVRKSHRFALDAAAVLLKNAIAVEEADTSVAAWARIKATKFDLILVDNDFKDSALPGRLPGIALLQLARKEGANKETPIVFCSAETFETLKPMVEKYGGTVLPKTGYDIDSAAGVFADLIRK